jgi:hypothetical protein
VPNNNIPPKPVKTREDLRAESLSKAIDSIGLAEFLPHLLDYLRIDVPFVGILLLLLDEHNRPFHIYDTIQTPYRINLDMYLDGVYQLDPFYTHFCIHRKTGALLIRDVAPDRFSQTEYYRRYYKNIELQDEMAIFTDLHDGRFLFFSIGRRASEMRFRRNDLKAINRDLPVLAALCRQHFGEYSYNQESLSGNVGEGRLQYAPFVQVAGARNRYQPGDRQDSSPQPVSQARHLIAKRAIPQVSEYAGLKES